MRTPSFLFLMKRSSCLLLLLMTCALDPASASRVTFSFALIRPSGQYRKRDLCSSNIMSSSLSLKSAEDSSDTDGKRLVLIRHGRTYMNEYLAKPGSRWGDPHFTDVFPADDHHDFHYRDSPLSPTGMQQAQKLSHRVGKMLTVKEDLPEPDIDLIAVSPLTRALQTVELGLLPHHKEFSVSAGTNVDGPHIDAPVVAIPHAAERLYFVSDIGRSRADLKKSFPFADFDTGFCEWKQKDPCWWFQVEDLGSQEYQEWRPNDANQIYSCPGEPDHAFDQRMMELYKWLESRPERTIALVCHWGVIRWLTGEEFDNCEMRIIPFEQIRPQSPLFK